MRERSVFVTGAGGFIGLELRDHLESRGYRVTGIDVRYPDSVQARPNLHVCDYRDSARVRQLLSGHDSVVHLASAHLDVSMSDEEYRSINVTGLVDFLSACSETGIQRFCHISSVGVYGNLASWPANEKTECHPQSIYGETKLAGEAVVRRHAATAQLDSVILRPAWVYGASCPRTRKLVRALRKRSFPMIGSGHNVRHPIYIKDMLMALERALDRPATETETFIVGGPEVVTTCELIDAMCDELDLPRPLLRVPLWAGLMAARTIEALAAALRVRPPVSRRTLEFFNTNNGFDVSGARERLGFEARFDLRAGLRDMRSELERPRKIVKQNRTIDV